MKRDECKKILAKILRRVARFYDKREMREGFDRCRYFPLTLDSVYLFGSYLKGKEEPNDVDLIIIYDELDSWEEVWRTRCDMRGHWSVATAVKKLCKGIDKEKMSVLTGTDLNQVRRIFPEDKYVYIQEAYLLWSCFDNSPVLFPPGPLDEKGNPKPKWPTALEEVHLGKLDPGRVLPPIKGVQAKR